MTSSSQTGSLILPCALVAFLGNVLVSTTLRKHQQTAVRWPPRFLSWDETDSVTSKCFRPIAMTRKTNLDGKQL